MAYTFPGWNCEINKIPLHPAYDAKAVDPLYPNALGEDESFRTAATTLREKKWQDLMNDITDKPDWQRKVRDKEIQTKWKHEALEHGRSLPEGFSERMADEMIKELQQKATEFESTGWVVAYDPGVIKSDTAVSESLKNSLRAAVRVLEIVPESAKDWHPNSGEQVLDLVHPSLWPLIYGQTKILPPKNGYSTDPIADIGHGERLKGLSENRNTWQYSTLFQWLPADMHYDENKHAKFSSYINNLHPQRHRNLYEIIEKVVDAALPLWSRTLSSYPIKQRIVYDEIEYHAMPEIPREEGETDDEYEDRTWETYEDMKAEYVVQPEPHGEEIKYEITDLKEKFHAGLQVIVKLANIELKPGESYSGGSWHVEGQSNEHIVATALYYYDSQNITESRLAFRQSPDGEEFDYNTFWHTDWSYEQGEDHFLHSVFGLENMEPTVQEIGSVRCQEGRLLTFPNTLQHRVGPFELQDKSKPGHRKILALFLVDPHLSIISTRSVPPQQQNWWRDRILETEGISFVQKLPPEIVQLIFSYVDDPMPLSAAKDWRLMLIKERSNYVNDQETHFSDAMYSLCEH